MCLLMSRKGYDVRIQISHSVTVGWWGWSLFFLFTSLPFPSCSAFNTSLHFLPLFPSVLSFQHVTSATLPFERKKKKKRERENCLDATEKNKNKRKRKNKEENEKKKKRKMKRRKRGRKISRKARERKKEKWEKERREHFRCNEGE